MSKDLVIGLDIGTTSLKAVMFDSKGSLISEAEEMVTTLYPEQGFVEQDPNEIERLSRKVLKDVVKNANLTAIDVVAVGISCAMHSLICVDENGEALSNMLIWSDGRSKEQVEQLLQENGKEIYMRTGTPIHPMSPLLKLMWMKDNQYQPYLDATYFMTLKEYLLYKWYGKRVVDYAMASSTGLLNLNNLDWDEEALRLAGVKKEQLSAIVDPTEILTGMDPQIAEEIGYSTDFPIVIGSADGQLANLGSGAILPGEVNVSVGTSGAIRQFTNGFPINESRETFTYAFDKETSIIGGPTNNGGIALQWAKDFLEFQGSHDEFLAGVDEVGPGANGLIFHPYINGERAPLWTPHAKGNLFGLSIGHKRIHIAKAVLEGITFNIYQIGQSLEKLAGKPKKITVNGGLSRSKLWVQIMADVFGQEIYVSETHNNAAWGAAWTALVATGKAENFAGIKENLPKEIEFKPNMDRHKQYQSIYEKYVQIGTDLVNHFH